MSERARSYDGVLMDRVTLRMREGRVDRLDRAVEAGHAPNRSELIRQAVEAHLDDLDLQPIRCDGGQTVGGGVKGTRILNCDNCGQITLHEIVYSEHYEQDCYRCQRCQLTKPTEQITLQEAAES